MIVEPKNLVHFQDLILTNVETWLNESLTGPDWQGNKVEGPRALHFARCMTAFTRMKASSPFGWVSVGIYSSGYEKTELDPWGRSGVSPEDNAFIESTQATLEGFLRAGCLAEDGQEQSVINSEWGERLTNKFLEICDRETKNEWQRVKDEQALAAAFDGKKEG